ncbi:MAG: hypothetical protein BM558_03990 [Roseobacter sp. MedPE-SW]|nr:MAG: hypothetical protein BM558_03990 [Roseobacter sp. MedPE-SW]
MPIDPPETGGDAETKPTSQVTCSVIRSMAAECAETATQNHRMAQNQFQTIWFLLMGGLALVLILPFIIQKLDDFLSEGRKLDPAIVEDAKTVDASLKDIQTNQNADRDTVTSRLDELTTQRDQAVSIVEKLEDDLVRSLSPPLSTWEEVGPYRYEEIEVQLHRRLAEDRIVGMAWDMNNSLGQAVFLEWSNDTFETSPFPNALSDDVTFAAITQQPSGALLVGSNSGLKSDSPQFHITRRNRDGWQEIYTGSGTLADIKVTETGEVFAFGSSKISETRTEPLFIQVAGLGQPKPVQDALNLIPPNSMITSVLDRSDGTLIVYGLTTSPSATANTRFTISRDPTGVWTLIDTLPGFENGAQNADQSPTELVIGKPLDTPESPPRILAITSNFQSPNRLLSSADGLTWQRPQGETPTEVSALTYSERYGFVAAGLVGTKDQKSPRIWVSTNGLTWKSQGFEQYGSPLDTPFSLLTSLPSGEIFISGSHGNFVSFQIENQGDLNLSDQLEEIPFDSPDLSPPGTSETLREVENQIREIDSVGPLIDDQQKIVARANAYSKTLEDSIKQYDEVRAALDQSLRNNELTRQITQTATRIAVIGMLIYLVQIVVNRYRYLQRLASFYQARAQALHILADQADQTLLKGITISDLATLLSPDSIGFDSAPEAPTQQMVALLQAGIRANR